MFGLIEFCLRSDSRHKKVILSADICLNDSDCPENSGVPVSIKQAKMTPYFTWALQLDKYLNKGKPEAKPSTRHSPFFHRLSTVCFFSTLAPGCKKKVFHKAETLVTNGFEAYKQML